MQLVPIAAAFVLVLATHASGAAITRRAPANDANPRAEVSMAQSFLSKGRVVEKKWGGEQRILIELSARPVLDRAAPGSVAETARQREQLARDLAAIDARIHSRTPSRITRQYHRLFSGVGATVAGEAIVEIRRLPNVRTVAADIEVRPNLTESVPWIGATSVSSTYGVTGAGVKVAIIDTGVDYTHPDLGGCFGPGCRVAGGHDFVNDDTDPFDDHGHGTHVAGIVAANGTLKGVAPGATLLAYKVLGASGSGYASDIIAALERAVDDGAKVANLSLGGGGDPDDPTCQALDNATAAGLLSVVAAGNSGPDHYTIGSPGTARTALTVGAVSKTGDLAGFSSRGPVVSGEEYLLKPEITAPGVAIRSAVPATGGLGNPTRYASLSGTSMATPHVAGAAALLLEWKTSLTPPEIKLRLVNSARSSAEPLFREGAGAVDLVAAFGLQGVASPAAVSFGVIPDSASMVVLEQALTIRNVTSNSAAFTLALGTPAFPAGTTLEIVPSSVDLAAGQSTNVTLRLRVDTSVTAAPPAPYTYDTNVVIDGGGVRTNVPVHFMRAAVLNVTFGEIPWVVYVFNREHRLSFHFFDPRTTSMTLLGPPGEWDVIANFSFYTNERLQLVVRDAWQVAGRATTHLAPTEAIHTIDVRPVDETGATLPQEAQMQARGIIGLKDPADPDKILFGAAIYVSDWWLNFRISPFSDRYAFGLLGFGADAGTARHFAYSWAAHGVQGDVTLPAPGVPMRRLEVGTPAGAEMTFVDELGLDKSDPGFGYIYSITTRTSLHPTWTLYSQTAASTGPPLFPMHYHRYSILDSATHAAIETVYGPVLRHEDGDVLVDRPTINADADEPLDRLRAPDAVLGPAIGRWNLAAPPLSLSLRFQNKPSIIQAMDDRISMPGWTTQSAAYVHTVAGAEPRFTMTNENWSSSWPIRWLGRRDGVSTSPGPQMVDAAATYPIASVEGTTRVRALFDTTRPDPNPPFVSRFRVEQNGVRTATPFEPSLGTTTTIRFNVTDDTSLTSVILEWKQNGATTWQPLPFQNAGSDYEVLFQLEGRIDLRLTATDASGNSFREEWLPAIVTTGAAPPTQPRLVRATQESPASIRVSWNPSSSQTAIREYRIERLPGNVLFTVNANNTTFLDTSGLDADGTYLYRVVAVRVDDVASAPSAYDVATLVPFADDPVVPGVTVVRGAQIAALRKAVDGLRRAAGLTPAWTSYNVAVGLIGASDFITVRDRLNEACTSAGLSQTQFVAPLSVGASIRASHLQALIDRLR